MSSQFVTMPCSMGYLRVRIPLLLWASSPTYESFWPIPTITPWCLGRPTMEGNTARGASSPAKPALHIPEPLSTTKAATSSSAILVCCWIKKLNILAFTGVYLRLNDQLNRSERENGLRKNMYPGGNHRIISSPYLVIISDLFDPIAFKIFLTGWKTRTTSDNYWRNQQRSS